MSNCSLCCQWRCAHNHFTFRTTSSTVVLACTDMRTTKYIRKYRNMNMKYKYEMKKKNYLAFREYKYVKKIIFFIFEYKYKLHYIYKLVCILFYIFWAAITAQNLCPEAGGTAIVRILIEDYQRCLVIQQLRSLSFFCCQLLILEQGSAIEFYVISHPIWSAA